MPTNFPIMPIIVAVLFLLPIRLTSQAMKTLAFSIWVVGGIVLSIRGVNFMIDSPEHANTALIAGLAVLALAVGYGKGKFVLSKTSAKNIERIEQFTEPKKPIQVYSVRSWVMITLMVGISVALNVFQVANIIRGPINLAVGFALMISSLAYLKAMSCSNKPSAVSH